jgi:hypothetical protein
VLVGAPEAFVASRTVMSLPLTETSSVELGPGLRNSAVTALPPS